MFACLHCVLEISLKQPLPNILHNSVFYLLWQVKLWMKLEFEEKFQFADTTEHWKDSEELL